ncbi:hypothetical protein [Martelella sp. FOR1707]
MSIFDRLDRVASRTVDRTFAVGATVDPMTHPPNGRPMSDSQREEILLKGVFSEASEYAQIEEGARDRNGNDFRTLVHGQRFEFSVDVVRYPAAKDIRQGDRLTLDDARRFEISTVEPDGMSRVVLKLVRA